jgi:hypothetical protein
MKPKKDDLAAGRLGKPAGLKSRRTLPGPKSEYGAGRLGIVSSESDTDDTAALPTCPQEPKPQHETIAGVDVGVDIDIDLDAAIKVQPSKHPDSLGLDLDQMDMDSEFVLPQAQGRAGQHPTLDEILQPDEASQSAPAKPVQSARQTAPALQSQRPFPDQASQAYSEVPAANIVLPSRRKIIWISGVSGLCALMIGIMIARSGQSHEPASAVASPYDPVIISPAQPQPTDENVVQASPAKPMAKAKARPIEADAVQTPVAESPLAKVTIPASQKVSNDMVEQALGTLAPAQSPVAQKPSSPAVVAPAVAAASRSVTYREVPSGFKLGGIINCPDGAYASINDRLVKAGGVVNGAKVIQVRDFSVEMEVEGQRFILAIGADTTPTTEDESADDEQDPKPAGKSKMKAAAETSPADADESDQPPAKPAKKKRSTPKSDQ